MSNKNNFDPDSARIVVVDDDIYLLAAIQQTLGMHGFRTRIFDKAADALAAVTPHEAPVVVLADVKMPKIDGLVLLEQIKKLDPELPVIMMTGHGDITMAVAAMKKGAYDFLEKPVDEDIMLAALGRAMEKARLVHENRRLQQRLQAAAASRTCFHGLVGRHPAMQHLYDLLQIVARENDTVLIQGETGTGKELVAHAIHNLSSRRDKLFVAVNMGAIPAEMMEAELFGYQKGAFTGAVQSREGKFEHVGEGTLFLDEICSLPVTLQAKLLRILEERAFCRLGSNNPVTMAARIITATNRDLATEIKRGTFRQDLYFRLNALPISIPALRDRTSDIPLLAAHFFSEYCRDRQLDMKPLAPAAIDRMLGMNWPGNVRELRNHVRRLCIYGPGSDPSSAGGFEKNTNLRNLGSEELRLKMVLEDAEKRHILETLRRHNGSIVATHAVLGISRKCLYDKISKYEINMTSLRGKNNDAGNNGEGCARTKRHPG